MEYCRRCCYPKNARPYIVFDEEGICSGCRVAEKFYDVDWDERMAAFKDLAAKYKAIAKERKNFWDCIIPVSGGKDSHYQVHVAKHVLGLNPLLVTYNHMFNTPLGTRNLRNLVQKLSCDNIRFTSNPDAVRRLSSYMLKKCGDLTWHYHAGILTYPLQMAVKFNIPLIIWGENNYSHLVGTFNPDDMVEFSRKHRKDFGLRGIEAEEAVGQDGIQWGDVAPFVYPDDEEIERVGVKGVYISNYVEWDEKKHTEKMIDLYDFAPAKAPRDRTFNLYAKLEDCHANGSHDYLKYLKFGYGRATDDASMMIRQGFITREEGIEYVRRHDHVRPRDLDIWLKFTGMSEKEFLEHVEPMREKKIWRKDERGEWHVKDSIVNHIEDEGVEEARLPLINEHRKEFIEGKYHVDDSRWLGDYDGYVTL